MFSLDNMNILALETSQPFCSVALCYQGKYYERIDRRPKHQAKIILSLVDEVLKEANIDLKALDAIAFGQGPGSFTGVRLAASVAQGLAFGAQLAIIPVPSLEAMAYQMVTKCPIIVAIDARKNEVYSATYQWQSNHLTLIGDLAVIAPEQLSCPLDSPIHVCGDGWQVYGDKIPEQLKKQIEKVNESIEANAKAIAKLALTKPAVPLWEALPLYTRDNVVG